MKRKLLYALLSVAIAFGLWAYVITTVSPGWEETYYNIPVVLENESVLNERGLMIAVEESPKVALTLSGNRSDLIKLNSDNITLIADLSRISAAGKQRVSYTIDYPGDVPDNAIEILNQSPHEITLTIAERRNKDVPVVPVYNGAVPEGFRTDKENLTLDYRYVNVVGPAEVVDKIERAVIEVNLEGQTETISESYRYILCDADGNAVDSEQVVTDVEEVRLTLKIQRYKELPLTLNIIPGGGATVDSATIEMDMETIQVSGSEQLLNSLGDELNLGEIRLGELTGDTELEFEIKLPEGVDNLTGKSVVTVSVDFKDLMTKTLRVTDITRRSVPAGMEVEILTKELAVTVRGTRSQVAALTAENLSIIVDFSEAQLGTDTYKALVIIDFGEFSNVGAVGSYSVDARVTEAGT